MAGKTFGQIVIGRANRACIVQILFTAGQTQGLSLHAIALVFTQYSWGAPVFCGRVPDEMIHEPLDAEVGSPVGRLETDTFCPHCHYNLVSQAVLRDQRLEVLVVRCPECGRFSTAGHGATASRAWLNRLATAFAAAWALFLALLLLLTTFFLGMISFGMVMAFARFEATPQMNPAGAPVRYTYHYVPTKPTDYPNAESDLRTQLIVMSSVTFALGFVAGGMVTVLLWHLRGWRRWLAILMPIVGCGVSFMIFTLDPIYESIRHWGQPRIAGAFALEMLGVIIGLQLGRPITRGLLRLLVPPKLRQHFVFLWLVDHKRLVIEKIV